MLRDDPHLQALVILDLKGPPLQALLDLLTEQTSLRIELSPEMAAAKPLFGSLSGGAPAWQVMQQAAVHNIVAGR